MIKVIIFDFGGVLFTNGTKRFVEILSKKYGLEQEKLTEVMDGEIGSLYRKAEISRDEFWKRLLDKLGIHADIDTLEEEWIYGYTLIEGTHKLIEELSKKYRIFFLSDNVRERVDKINAKYNFLRWFEDGVFSYEVGVRKPDPKIYQAVLAKARVTPEEAVFIDDKPEFLIPAKEIGMCTFVFENSKKLRKDLEKQNLL